MPKLGQFLNQPSRYGSIEVERISSRSRITFAHQSENLSVEICAGHSWMVVFRVGARSGFYEGDDLDEILTRFYSFLYSYDFYLYSDCRASYTPLSQDCKLTTELGVFEPYLPPGEEIRSWFLPNTIGSIVLYESVIESENLLLIEHLSDDFKALLNCDDGTLRFKAHSIEELIHSAQKKFMRILRAGQVVKTFRDRLNSQSDAISWSEHLGTVCPDGV